MKKRILICLTMLVALVSFSFAKTNDGINDRVNDSFKKDFANARDTRWDDGNDYAKATFNLNGNVVFAYYSHEGHLIAVTRNILSDRLPITQLISLKNNYRGYWITDLFEVYSNGETSYYAAIENADQKITLKSTSNGWETFSKLTKF